MLNSTESFIEMTVFCFAFVETHDHDYVVGFIYRLFCTIYLFIFMCCCCCWVASVMSDSMHPHRWQSTRLPHPWDSLGKNTGMGRYFLLQCVKGKSESEVAQSCPTLSDLMDCSLPGSSIHGSTGVGCHCLLQRARMPSCAAWTKKKLISLTKVWTNF